MAWAFLQLCAAHRVLADPAPDAGTSSHELHDHHAVDSEREQAHARANSPWVSATVGQDGIARFKDRSSLSTAHAATWYDQQYNRRIRETLPPDSGKARGLYDPEHDAPLISLRFRFDLEGLVTDTNQAARAQILENTERRRTYLSLQDRLCSSLDSRALKEYLGETPPKLPVAQHKHALFETYDACAESALGALARRLIQQAVEHSFPRQSQDAYTPTELKTLNDERIASYRFEPYE